MATPAIWWVRRDLRLGDNAALLAAIGQGRPVVPVFILDEVIEGHGSCPRWRFGLGAEELGRALVAKGSRLIFRRGNALEILRDLVVETGAEEVHWCRAYDPEQVTRDRSVKAGLLADGIKAESHSGHLLFEPWSVETKTGGFYKVFSPFWRAVRDREIPEPLPAPAKISAPDTWPASDDPANWRLAQAMDRGAAIVAPHLTIGEAAAGSRLSTFITHGIGAYGAARDVPATQGTSRLSENLTYGEISPRSVWHAGRRALAEGASGAEIFLKEVVWREFAYHLVWHTPRITSENWRGDWDAFPWNSDEAMDTVVAWKQGRTGIRFVDAAMREMYVTGYMHNRARMIVASYLTKHLMCHWRIGLDWFADCLIDWDPASNAMGWQWSAGSGPDAAPYFRVFNPITQLDKFDPHRTYVNRWIAEGQKDPPQTAADYFRAIPRSWGMTVGDDYPEPMVRHEVGRARALAAYENRGF